MRRRNIIIINNNNPRTGKNFLDRKDDMSIREILYWALEGIKATRAKYIALQQRKRTPPSAADLILDRLQALEYKEKVIRLLLKILKEGPDEEAIRKLDR